MPYLLIVVVVVSAVFYYRAAEFENESALIWTGLSLLTSVVYVFVLHCGWLGCLLGQLGLFAGITIFRMLRKP
jgi:hypothetical protein